MKRQIKYRVTMIPKKLSMELRITVDTSKTKFAPNGESTSEINGDVYTGISLFPLICLSIVRPADYDDAGQRQRAPFNPNDNLGMTRYHFPIFVCELDRANTNLKVPELYSYVSQRLTVNEELSERYRQVFAIGNVTVEIQPVVINQPDESRVEGVKLKFNNEQSTVLLTLNDLESLLFTMKTFNIDGVAMQIHLTYLRNLQSSVPNAVTAQRGAEIDIKPKDLDGIG